MPVLGSLSDQGGKRMLWLTGFTMLSVVMTALMGSGVALCSTWTAARTMMVELSPPEKLGEFMGIYNLTGKFSD